MTGESTGAPVNTIVVRSANAGPPLANAGRVALTRSFMDAREGQQEDS